MVRCSDGTLYTGITNNLGSRLEKHNSGLGACYTRSRRPVYLVYFISVANRSVALKHEYRIKQLTRTCKEKLIQDSEQLRVRGMQ